MNIAKILFLHHSTGADLIKYGRVREGLSKAAAQIELWDHGYEPTTGNWVQRLFQPYIFGLRDGHGELRSETFHIPDDNTNPDGLARLFSLDSGEDTALRQILAFDIIIFKSCFPVTRISTDADLDRYKSCYLNIRECIRKHPDRLFIPMSPPPLRSSLTTKSCAARARMFASWLMSSDFRSSIENLIPYDYFDALAANAGDRYPNVLRPEYCRPLWFDSHPNARAHATVAPHWINHVLDAMSAFRPPPGCSHGSVS
jgi:hypothetical protein